MSRPTLRARTAASFFSIVLTLIVWQPASAELKSNRAGTLVTDTHTDLMWVADASLAGQTMTWQEAMDWAANLEYEGYSDWRLPSAEDPDGTVCFSDGGPGGSTQDCSETEFGHLFVVEGIRQVPATPFQNISAISYYWTSSESPDDASKAMVFNFGVAAVGSVGSPVDIFKTSDDTSLPWAVRDHPWWANLTGRWAALLILLGIVVIVVWGIFGRKRKIP